MDATVSQFSNKNTKEHKNTPNDQTKWRESLMQSLKLCVGGVYILLLIKQCLSSGHKTNEIKLKGITRRRVASLVSLDCVEVEQNCSIFSLTQQLISLHQSTSKLHL